eukprot:CAMPEP_0170214306 /NCGR_PEP_ID=MMETSP0116_2-20130129/6783_1 /TAXON_ID=400756 /ORGANISM="Durinskia baltica, Strain CSIRO CS-38" /LENGTH=460 /DNA_ID=CAMNT_0010464869 /DNA_START=67 /DNA_END=1449 /DNA_ORIENTATION=-
MAPGLKSALLFAAVPATAPAAGSWADWLRGASPAADEAAIVGDFALSDEADVSALDTTTSSPPDSSKWEPLTELLQKWEFTRNYAIAVGTAEHGRLFMYEGGKFKMSTQIPTGSTSKWPSAMLFAGLVNDGTIKSLDDPVSKYLSWWTRDRRDPRSTVTFRMLLSFTSGFGDGHPGEEANTRAARDWRASHSIQKAPATLQERLTLEIGDEGAIKCNTTTGDIMECARSIYENVKLIGKPGQVYSYNSNHLQIAAAVAVATTGLEIHNVIHKYLLVPYNMTNSYYEGKCPDFGGSLVTTGYDYENFLAGVLGYRALKKEIIDASEEDATPFMASSYTLYGDYGFGHFLWCFDSVDGMTGACKEAQVHADPGAFGFIPLVDRKHGYYLEVVAAEIEPTGSYPLSGIPEYLAVAIKPHVDAIMAKHSPDAMKHLTHSPGLLSLTIADINYCLNCVLHPKECS